MRPIVCGGIFLETLFFCQRTAFSLAWERRGLLNGRCITLMWACCYCCRSLECESKLNAWKKASVALLLIFQSQAVLLSCTFSNPTRSASTISSSQPTRLFPWRLLFVLYKGTFGFLRYSRDRERWLLLSFSFAEAVLLHRQVWFLHASLKSGWVRVYGEKPQDQSVLCSM